MKSNTQCGDRLKYLIDMGGNSWKIELCHYYLSHTSCYEILNFSLHSRLYINPYKKEFEK